MGVGNELGQKLGHRQVGIPVVNIEGGDGQPHNRTEDVTANELEGTALNEAQREAKEVVDGVGMLAQLVHELQAVHHRHVPVDGRQVDAEVIGMRLMTFMAWWVH